MDRSEAETAAADGLCFHCGLPVPAGMRFFAVIDGARRAMCCAGCQAVAHAICAGGFEAYYRDRTALPPAAEVEDAADDLAIYDLPEVQRGLVRAFPGALEADLLLQGITCAACIWLNEQHVAKLPGVLAMHVNYTSHRACVRWDPQRIRLSDILRAIRAIGYRAFPATDATAQAARKREDRALLWRLFVAGFGMMQVMMYALPAYLAEDGTMSADIARLMRIASLVLTVPVVLFSCGPFFRGAWRDLKLRRLGMDVPIARGHRRGVCRQRVRDALRRRRGVFRLHHHVRVFPAERPLSRAARPAQGRDEPRVPGPCHSARRASSGELSREPRYRRGRCGDLAAG